MRLTLRSAFVFALALLGGCGHTIPGSLTGGPPYDFLMPHDCAEVKPVGDQIEVRYLGSGGVYLSWRKEAILLGPSFSNPGLIRAQFLRVKPNKTRIETALKRIEIETVRGILAGHSHYDHIGDVPAVACKIAKLPDGEKVPIWVNASGMFSLNGEDGLRDRLRELKAGVAFDVTPSIRVRPVSSSHAPQLCKWRRFPCVFANGPILEPWTTPLPFHRLASMRGGETMALVIELHDGDVIRYRIYYNDAASDPLLAPPEGTFDLAILTMAQWNWARDYPRDLLSRLRPRHVVVSHWDNFFAEAQQRTRFVPNLSNGNAARFLKIVNEEVWVDDAGPVNKVCGVPTPRWTMPAPTTSMIFNPR